MATVGVKRLIKKLLTYVLIGLSCTWASWSDVVWWRCQFTWACFTHCRAVIASTTGRRCTRSGDASSELNSPTSRVRSLRSLTQVCQSKCCKIILRSTLNIPERNRLIKPTFTANSYLVMLQCGRGAAPRWDLHPPLCPSVPCLRFSRNLYIAIFGK